MQKYPDLIFISDTVHGALRCLALFAGDLDDVQLPPLVPVLFPALFAIVTSPDVSFSFFSSYRVPKVQFSEDGVTLCCLSCTLSAHDGLVFF